MTQRTLLGRLAATSAAAAVAAAGAFPVAQAAEQTGDESDVPTFKEFEAQTFQDEDGQYVVNGDEAVPHRGALRRFYERMTEGSDESGLIVNQTYAGDDVWSARQAQDLTYCVSDKFRDDKAVVVDAMEYGAALWENASSGVDFTHVPAADRKCHTPNNGVVFSVEPTNKSRYIARAFFPSSPDRQRSIMVNADSLQNAGSWTPGNIMGHELGHTLGFRHEHTRPEAGTCYEDDNWRPLTPYDSASIMHYPQCNGSSDELTFSDYDGQGVRSVYGD